MRNRKFKQTRREHAKEFAAGAALSALGVPAPGAATEYGSDTLPVGIRSRFAHNVNGLAMHFLEAGFETRGRPCVLLLHGFPELAYSWRKVMPPLAEAGYHVVAPDQRGYGRTTGWDGRYDGDVASFRMLNIVRDAMGLLFALGYRTAASVIGHDFGSPAAAWCALVRPDVFRSVALMSAPFGGPPDPPFDTIGKGDGGGGADIHAQLAGLKPPRKHYQWYYSTREADADMHRCPQGVHAFLRAYYHYKSADWKGNRPHPLQSWTGAELAKLPTYYVMELDKGMAATVAPEMPSARAIAACHWLTEAELRVYSSEFERTGFQGGLQWYRCATNPAAYSADLEIFSGRVIEAPSCFIAGASDWGVYQRPGAAERMQRVVCPKMTGSHLIEGAGHWVQQEKGEETARLLVEFLRRAA